MNFGLILQAIAFASEHKSDIAAGAKGLIAGIQAIENVCHKHGKSLDHVLHIANQVCDAVNHPPESRDVPEDADADEKKI